MELNLLQKLGVVLVNSDLAARKSILHLQPYKSAFRPFLKSLYKHKYPSQRVFSSSLTLFGVHHIGDGVVFSDAFQ
eukprot:1096148-Rhodomonas_salina.1